jgi:hypothetical protein
MVYYALAIAICLGLIGLAMALTVWLATRHRIPMRQWSASADRWSDGRQRLGTDQPRAP